MGIGKSQQRSQCLQQKPSLKSEYDNRNGKAHESSFSERQRLISTVSSTFPAHTRLLSHQPLYGSRPLTDPIPAYVPFLQIASPFLQLPYNNFPVSLCTPHQSMMFLPQIPPAMATPYIASPVSPLPSSPMSMPQEQQIQGPHMYNNIGISNWASMGVSGATGFYPPSGLTEPARFVTDWTLGGRISPGFLGPPI